MLIIKEILAASSSLKILNQVIADGLCSLILLFPDHQHIKIIFQRQVSVFVNEPVCTAFLRGIHMGKIIQIKAFVYQFLFVQGNLAFGRGKFGQYPPVFPQDVVNIPHIVGHFTVQPVVVIIPAHIRTEFFINSPGNGFTAVETKFFHRSKKEQILI